MSFFDLTTPDGDALSGTTVITVVGLMFMYTFVGICAGFGGGLTTMPLVSMLLPVKNGGTDVRYGWYRNSSLRDMVIS